MADTGTLSDRTLERSADSPVDMASLEAAQDEKRRLLDSAASAAATLMTGPDVLPAGCGPEDGPALLRRFYAGGPAAEASAREPEERAPLAAATLRRAARRPPGPPLAAAHRTASGQAVLRVVIA